MQEFLDSKTGKLTIAGACLVVVAVGVMLMRNIRISAAAIANHRMFIDATNSKPFEHDLEMGESFPIEAPSGNKSGYPAEECYWTADGQISKEPTYVLLKDWLHQRGPTFCPVCGRLVVAHNSHPQPGDGAPPTEAEWKQKHPKSSADTGNRAAR